jgi:5-hydroxyisourate hydrolase-like protein (transthyretin family)
MKNFWLILVLSGIAHINLAQTTKKMTPWDYEKAWKEVSDYEQRGLPKSALTTVETIYAQAKKESNAPQLVKAILFRLKLIEHEDDAYTKNLESIRTEAEQAGFPAKPLLHSMLAEMYWRYYQNNRYRFRQRSDITSNAEEGRDVETWGLERIIRETGEQYTLSLQDAAKSQGTSIAVYQEMVYAGNAKGRTARPTLYDFLVHRAITFFGAEEPSLPRPAYAFTLDQDAYFGDAQAFAALTLTTRDTASLKFKALTLLQAVTRFHLNDRDPAALIDVDLERLQFVRAHATLSNKLELYRGALEKLEKKLDAQPVSALVSYSVAQTYVETATRYKPLVSDAHKNDLKIAYERCETVKKRFPGSDGAQLCENLQVQIKQHSVSARLEENNLPAQPFRCLVQYRNFQDLHYRLIRVTSDEVRAQRKRQERSSSSDRELDFLRYFLAKTSVKTGRFTLPDDGDYQTHSLEVKLDGVPEGEYMVILSNRADFSGGENAMAYAFTRVTLISYIHRNMPDGTIEFHVLNRQTGEPLASAKVEVYGSKYNYSKSTYEPVLVGGYATDPRGYVKVPYVRNDEMSGLFTNFTYHKDFTSTVPIDQQSYYYGTMHQYKEPPRSEYIQTMFFLDRAIYRPGQTIYFKGLVTRTNGAKSEILPKHRTTVTLLDVNSQPRGVVEVTTNEFGTFSGTFTAPTSGLTGQMTLRTDDNAGEASFSVEEYKRPKFEATFDPVKASFRLNESIHTEGKAKAYSGAAIDGAKVQYRVVRVANFPYWWYYRWGYYPQSQEMEIAHGETATDATGKFAVDFTAIPDLTVDRASDPTFNYTIYADVTDINGETHTATTTVSVGYKSLLLQVPVANLDKDAAKAPELAIHATNLAGEPQTTQGTITIYPLKAPVKAFRSRLWEQPDRHLYTQDEYYSLFPADLYADEANKFTWEQEKAIVTLSFNTAEKTSFTINDLAKWKPGEYVLEIAANDKDGQPVKEVTYFTVYSLQAKTLATPAVHSFQPIKLTAEPGETATFMAGTSARRISVLYEVEHDGNILSKDWVSLGDEQRLFKIPVEESHRGNLAIHYTFVYNNRLYHQSEIVYVPYTNKALDITFESFRDKLLPGQQEQWKIRIKGKTADKVAAEMVATLYDASLDAFRAHGWSASFFESFYAQLNWSSTKGFDVESLTIYDHDWNRYPHNSPEMPRYDELNWYGYNFYYYHDRRIMKKSARGGVVMEEARMDMMSVAPVAAAPMAEKEMADESKAEAGFGGVPGGAPKVGGKVDAPVAPREDFGAVQARTNFNETAFFYPHLQTNAEGEIIIGFTIPEALTRWKMLGFAHTQDLKSGLITNELVTQKDLMVVPNQPRFFRENDKMVFQAKVTSMTDKPLQGQAQLEFFDALTGKPATGVLAAGAVRDFSVAARQSTNVTWNISIPEGLQALTYRVVAKSGNFADGEEMTLPVVTNRMLVTETLPLPIRGKQSKDFRFEKLLTNKSTTLRHQQFTLEFTSNPAWYAIQALPYLMEYPYECVEQTFSRFYANSIASHVANSSPRIKQVFDTWKNIQPNALLSNLEKNQELKSALLEETPWVLQAQDETQRKRAVGLLFDLNRMANEQGRAVDKIVKAQTSSGGFSWFPGCPEDLYMTQHIITGMGHLDVMGVRSVRDEDGTWSMVRSALGYMDSQLQKQYDELKDRVRRKLAKLEDNNLGYGQIQYLYARTYFSDIAVPAQNQEAYNYYVGQAKKYWLDYNLYLEGMLCLTLHRTGDKVTPAAMIKSFNERALHNEEMGMYWKSEHGYYWYQAPIETQALMIEVYDEVAKDTKSVEDMKVWLLKQKQTQDWKTTKATTEACYALLRRGVSQLVSTALVDIKVGDQVVDPAKRPDAAVEAGTGYFKTAWQAPEINSKFGNIHVTKRDEGVAWGAAYWQYFEQLDKITPAETPLKLKKELFKEVRTDRGPVITTITEQTPLQVGDLVKVRIELRTDRTMEYVHLKDMRAAGFEPVSTLSTHRYQDGLYYYESPRDLATNFFMGYLPKGTYVFEYDLRVSQQGDFSNGITTIQCMYAPEFSSHSAGIRVHVK